MAINPQFNRKLLTIMITGLACGADMAVSQNAPALEEVVVTAQKRAQSLQDVPLAVSALSGEALLDAGINDIVDLSRQVPSLSVQNSNGVMTSNYRMRRVGNIGNIPNFEPAVGVFLDGAYRSRPFFSSGDMFDIERIEVLRGPQSTLYGKNTTAGVLAIYTKSPAENFEGNASLDVGNVEGAQDATMGRFVGGVSGPLTDTLGGSLGVSLVDQDHTYESALSASDAEANNLKRQAVRGQLQWDASDALTARLIVGYMEEDDDTSQADVFFAPGSGASIARDVLVAGGISQSCSSNDPMDQRHCSRTSQTTDVKASEATLLMDYALDNGWTVTSITSWDWFKFKGSQDDVTQLSAPLLKFHDSQESDSWQQELRLTSAGGETVDWLAGIFYYQNDFDRGDHGDSYFFLEDTDSAAVLPSVLLASIFGVPTPFAAPGQNGIYNGKQDTEYLGIFGQATWNITEKFAVTGGLRWQEEEKDASVRQEVTVPGRSLLSLNLLVEENSGGLDRTTDEVTWSITPQYFIHEDLTVYATAAHGFKSGGFNIGWGTTPLDQRQFQDEDIMHYEAGVKSTLLDGRMQLAFSGFYTEYNDYQDAAFISQQFSVGNAQKVELKGAELEGKVLLGQHFSSDFAISYADLTYDKYTDGLCYPGRTPSNPAEGTCDLSGDHPINAPEWTTHLGLMYQTDVSWGEVYARTDWSWSDEYNTSFSADPSKMQDAYSWLNFRLGTRWDSYEVVAWIDNATDEKVANYDSQLNLFANDPSYQTYRQAPRSYGLTGRYTF
jgi:outer membrane receptor protein involved in Fe transport